MDLDLGALRRRAARADATGAEFTVLTVCTGNICRSVLAAAELHSRLADELGVVRSAGTDVNPSLRVPPPIADAMRAVGGSAADHRPIPLDARALEEADLVLVATRAHRARVAQMSPTVAARAYTMREFARIARDILRSGSWSPATPWVAVAAVSARRGLVPRPADASVDDVPDPFGGSADDYAAAIALVRDAMAITAECLAPARAAPDASAGGADAVAHRA